MFSNTPKPPYYAVIFTSVRTNEDDAGYAAAAQEMEALAAQQPGFLGLETARGEIGISVSYWQNYPSIQKWKAHLRHRWAQQKGRESWYADYAIRIAKVEQEKRPLRQR